MREIRAYAGPPAGWTLAAAALSSIEIGAAYAALYALLRPATPTLRPMPRGLLLGRANPRPRRLTDPPAADERDHRQPAARGPRDGGWAVAHIACHGRGDRSAVGGGCRAEKLSRGLCFVDPIYVRSKTGCEVSAPFESSKVGSAAEPHVCLISRIVGSVPPTIDQLFGIFLRKFRPVKQTLRVSRDNSLRTRLNGR